jgi:hypothetical protein
LKGAPEHNPVISYGWIKKGEDFEVLTHNSYRLNINGAVDVEKLRRLYGVFTKLPLKIKFAAYMDNLKAVLG